MLDRPRSHRPVGPAFDTDELRPSAGFLRRLADRLLRHRLKTGAAALLIIGAGIIVANAVFFQTVEHPSPLFATRPEAGATAVAAAPPTAAEPAADPMPIPRVRLPAGDSPRLVRVTPERPLEVAPQGRGGAAAIAEVQTALLGAGLYEGRVDGVFGARTRAAVEAYQRGQNLPVTGAVNEELLAHIRANPPAAGVGGEITAAIADPAEMRRLLAVKEALNRIGYGPVQVNGETTPATVDAIRRFQLDNGLALTGKVDAALVDKMVAIGALEPL